MVVTLSMYALAKISLALLFATGPVFILMAMWPPTHRYTEAWIGQALNYTLVGVLVSVANVAVTAFGMQYAIQIGENPDLTNVVAAGVSLVIACGSLLVVLLNLNNLATALTGGIGLSGVGREVAALTMAAVRRVGPGGGGMGAGNRLANGSSTRTQLPGPGSASQRSPGHLYQQGNRISAQQQP